MIKDSPASRSPATSMRDLLRRLDREINRSRPKRPNPPVTVAAPARSATTPDDPGGALTVGDWVLAQDGETGDLIATNTSTGATATVARRGGN